MNKNVNKEALSRLYQAMLTLKTEEECEQFLEDICTINEKNAMAQRFEVAELLAEECTYLKVEEKTGASSATISRVNKALIYGSGGYVTAIQRLHQEK